MKDKNDFKHKDFTPDIVEPIACLYCHHKELEEVQVHGAYGNFINRLGDMTVFGYLLAKRHRLYGYRCLYCGYVMWFTARNLD